MNPKIRLDLLVVAMFLLLSARVAAQSLPRAASDAAASKEDAVQLSPFEVHTERDVGFVAASALTGGRMATDLKDTAAAYSVITKEFIDTLGISSLSEATNWTVNASKVPDDNRNDTFTSPTPISFRGVSTQFQQRNFFYMGRGDYDSYNLDRFDFARGPNSILFGTGTGGGTPTVITKRARLGRSFGELTGTFGSWDEYRATLDVNGSYQDRLGVRLNTMWEDRKGWRDNEYAKAQGAHLVFAYRIAPNTELHVGAERWRQERTQPLTAMLDQISGWDGTTVFNNADLYTFSAQGVASPLSVPRQQSTGVSLLAPNRWVYIPGSGYAGIMNYQNRPISMGGGTSTAVALGGRPIAGTNVGSAGSPVLYSANLPADRFDRALTGARGLALPRREFNITPDAPIVTHKLQVLDLAMSHEYANKLFLELSGAVSKWQPEAELGYQRGGDSIRVDVNRQLPNGDPNPKFLQPFVEFQSTVGRGNDVITQNARLAAAYMLDGTRWGDFRFNVTAGLTEQAYREKFSLWMIDLNPDSRLQALENQTFFRYYFDEPPGSRPFSLPSQIKTFTPMPTAANPSAGVERTVRAGMVPRITGSRETFQNYQNLQAAAATKLLNKRLHLLGAVRRDYYDVSSRISNDNVMDWPTSFNFFDRPFITWKPAAPADWSTLTYQPRNPDGTAVNSAPLRATTRPRVSAAEAANPQLPYAALGLRSGGRKPEYANDRFQDDYSPLGIKDYTDTVSAGGVYHVTPWASVFFNYSETFLPPNGQKKWDGGLMAATTSNGYDAGLRFTFFRGNLVANFTRYDVKEQGLVIQQAAIGGNVNAILDARRVGNLAPGERNSRGLGPTIGDWDTTDRQANGYELEIVGNIGRGWRLMANAALPKATQGNTAPYWRGYFAEHKDALRQIVLDAGVLIDANNVATLDPAVPAGQAPDAARARDAWNALNGSILPNLIVGQQPMLRLNKQIANVYADYTFKEGRLSGLRLGAGAQYRGKSVIGYRGGDTIRNPANASSAIDDPAVGPLDAVWADPFYLFTLTAGYKWKIKPGLALQFDLRVENVLNESDPVYINTVLRPPGGDTSDPARIATPNTYYYQTPRSYSLTATLKF